MLANPNTASSEYGHASVRELCDKLEETFSALTQMRDRMNSGDLRPDPLPSKTSPEFTRAVLNYSLALSKIDDLSKSVRDMRFDVMRCTTGLETTFQHVHNLYNIMHNGLELARNASRVSILSTSTNLTARIKLADRLKGWEGTWGLSRQDKSSSASHPVSLQTPSHFIFRFSVLILFNLIM